METQIKDGIPHYLLFVETGRANNPGGWKFTWKEDSGNTKFEVADVEPGINGERLDLLTMVRALESLDQPSRVTMMSCPQYIRQGIEYGLAEWQVNDWQWEFFGYMVPVKNADLWRRMDHLLHVHSVEYRRFRIDGPHLVLAGPKTKESLQPTTRGLRAAAENLLKHAARMIPLTLRHRLSMAPHSIRPRFIHLPAASKPCPGSG